MKKICVVTGTRADYGLLRWLMHEIKNASKLELQVIATGMHLSPEFGLTYREIEIDGFEINFKLEMLLSSDSPIGITKSLGLGICGFADILSVLQPDLIVVLGDRYEIFAAAIAALIGCIPIAHIHGGETTEGAFDEAIRHSLTKMAHLHFVAAEEYRRRVIQLGEAPENVYLVGGLGIDNIKRLKLLEKECLENQLDFKFGPKNLLVTYHPVTFEPGLAKRQMSELLCALDQLKDTHIIFTMPNADTEGRFIFSMINDFVANHPRTSKVFVSLGQLRYLSCILHVDGVVGNSSSGLTEVPSFKKGTINIGDRQLGRLKAKSVIDCKPASKDILRAFDELYSPQFKINLANVVNPYGEGGASKKIVEVILAVLPSVVLKKRFFNLP